MAISITDPPELPNASDPSTFNEKAIAFFAWLTGDFISDLEGITSEDIANEGRLLGVQRFTSSGTYTPTAGTKYAIVEVQGGGGGGANGNSSTGEVGAGGGGNSGNYYKALIDVSAIGTATITVGAGGAGGATGGANGGDGGTSIWNDGSTTITAYGGLGGVSYSNLTGSYVGDPAALATSTAVSAGANFVQAMVLRKGGIAAAPFGLDTTAAAGSNGADSLLGTGGRARPRNGDGANVGGAAQGYGAGGAGGSCKGAVAGGADGGDGSGGVVIITEFTA